MDQLKEREGLPRKYSRGSHIRPKNVARKQDRAMEQVVQGYVEERYRLIKICHNECWMCGKWYSIIPYAGTWCCVECYVPMILLAAQDFVGYNHD